MSHSDSQSATEGAARIENAAHKGMRCDFCGDTVSRVRRVAIDGEYERLQTRHQVRYACESCSEEKERDRLGPG
jgi:uncharacterized protein with PIN domain